MKIEHVGTSRTLLAEIGDQNVRVSVGIVGTNLAVVDMHMTKEEAGAWALALLEKLT